MKARELEHNKRFQENEKPNNLDMGLGNSDPGGLSVLSPPYKLLV